MKIPEEELTIRAVRASGPGGQHVNKTSTKIEVRWNLLESPSLSDAQRERARLKLANRLDKNGELRIVCDETRSQRRNREIAIERLERLVTEALRVPRARKKTKPTLGSKRRLRAAKERRSKLKEQRRRPSPGE